MIRTLLRVSLHKITAFFGGRFALAIVIALICVCFSAASLISGAKPPETVYVAIADLSNGALSQALCQSVSETNGIRAEVYRSVSEGEDRLLYDSAEVLLIISPDYDEKVFSDTTESLVTIKTAPGSDSAQLIRETVAGLLISQKSEAAVKKKLVDEGLITENDESFRTYMNEVQTPNMYSFEMRNAQGTHKTDPASSGLLRGSYYGVVVLTLLLVLLTLTRRMSDASSRLVAERIETRNNGRDLALISDFLAMFFVALIISTAAFVLSPEKKLSATAALIAYSVCISGICLLVSKFNTTGRIDILAPFLAIVTSVIGGCFTDLSSLSETLRIVARCVPQGQMIAAEKGAWPFCLILLSEGMLTAFAAAWIARKNAVRKP